MKTICCVALLLAGSVHAGELLPMSGEEDEYIQEQLTEQLSDVVASLEPETTVEPILESFHYSGRFKRILFGPLVRGGHIKLRVRITDATGSTETIIDSESGAWRGTFQPGNDYEMIYQVAAQAAEFVAQYKITD